MFENRRQGSRRRLRYRPDVPAIIDGHRDAGTPSAFAADGHARQTATGYHGGGARLASIGSKLRNSGLENRLEVASGPVDNYAPRTGARGPRRDGGGGESGCKQ